jgi:N-acetylglucosamine-6-phosphate deacetylase
MPIVTAPRVYTGDAELTPGWVRTDGAVVGRVGEGDPPSPPDLRLSSGVLAPGLVDVQVNGHFGVDLAAADLEGWRTVVTGLPATGVTAFVPTVITAPVPELVAVLRRYAALRPALDVVPGAARTLGMHVEGPFLAARRRGAHREELLHDPTSDEVDALLHAGAHWTLRYLTLAPERPGAMAAVEQLVAAGVRVAIGHSDADAATVHAAADHGATLVTHLFNGQRPMHHRGPGVVGAALADRRLTCGLIADGHHVDADPIAIAFAAAEGRIMLVTDAVAATGMPSGRYVLGGDDVIVANGEAPRRPDGSLAGGGGGMDEAIGHAVAAGVPLRSALEAATRVPAEALGGDGREPLIGRIAPGSAADLVWLDGPTDDRLRTCGTWIRGRRAFTAGEGPG